MPERIKVRQKMTLLSNDRYLNFQFNQIYSNLMEKVPDLKLPNQLCQQIFNNEFQIDVGNVNEQIISKTIELYVQAMQFFANQISQYSDFPEFDLSMTQKKHNFYQQKIKRLLSRNQVQNCLVGKKTHQKTLDFEKELNKIHENAPQQTKLLIEYFKSHHKNQQKLINTSINQQQEKLDERIRRRSMSAHKGRPNLKNAQNERHQKMSKVLNGKLVSIL